MGKHKKHICGVYGWCGKCRPDVSASIKAGHRHVNQRGNAYGAGHVVSLEHRAIISAVMRDYWQDPNHAHSNGVGIPGENNPAKRPEVRAAISAACVKAWKQRSRMLSPQHRAAISAGCVKAWQRR